MIYLLDHKDNFYIIEILFMLNYLKIKKAEYKDNGDGKYHTSKDSRSAALE